MMQPASSDNLIKGAGYVVVVEEVTSTATLYDMFVQMSYLINGSEELVRQLDEVLPHLTGLQFIALHYYKDFVSPSNFEGYAIVTLTEVPERPNEIVAELCAQATDDELGRVFLLAAPSGSTDAAPALLKEADRIIKSRVKLLRNL